MLRNGRYGREDWMLAERPVSVSRGAHSSSEAPTRPVTSWR
jgi:hypothetical protein